ncbi:hypothetical protein E6C60_3566 [Paenibacillus algicola]|uniref:Uncharacterized protein n=1 Tax=Paenibacillus algicola TaxID=2565926 RepID=A0A4P8XN50_9BACL|nr:hypothetical protein E6C60_3566 [Paenibacillus algicola]
MAARAQAVDVTAIAFFERVDDFNSLAPFDHTAIHMFLLTLQIIPY